MRKKILSLLICLFIILINFQIVNADTQRTLVGNNITLVRNLNYNTASGQNITFKNPFYGSSLFITFISTGTGVTGNVDVACSMDATSNDFSNSGGSGWYSISYQVYQGGLLVNSGSNLSINFSSVVSNQGNIVTAPLPCIYISVRFTSFSSNTNSFSAFGNFVPYSSNINPFTGSFNINSNGYTFSHITGTTATAVKSTPGLLHTLTVGTGAAGTIQIFDLPSASCTGTPAGPMSVLTITATTLQTFIYDTNFTQGICIKASVAMDFTVSFN